MGESAEDLLPADPVFGEDDQSGRAGAGGALAGLLPVIRAARLSPTQALRSI